MVDAQRKNSHRRCAAAGGGSSGHRPGPGVPAAWSGCGRPPREGLQRSLGRRRVRRLGQDHRQGDPLVRVAGSVVLSWLASRTAVAGSRSGSGYRPTGSPPSSTRARKPVDLYHLGEMVATKQFARLAILPYGEVLCGSPLRIPASRHLACFAVRAEPAPSRPVPDRRHVAAQASCSERGVRISAPSRTSGSRTECPWAEPAAVTPAP